MVDPEKYLKQALKLAEKGRGLVSPNPLVGAVVVKGSRVLGQGWHRAFGLDHAEVEALNQAGGRAKGAALYVTLEPCCHYGKTPPCTEAIIRSGIKEVVCCVEDPNPLVSGRGFAALEKHGIKVRHGRLTGEAEELNRAYLVNLRRKRPYFILKWAETLDGRIAAHTGDSKWITEEETRDFTRTMRFECDAILTGIGTVLHDNPFLDYRPPSFQTRKELLARKRFTKCILDARLRTPLDANLWSGGRSAVTIFVSDRVEEARSALYRERGATVVKVKEQAGRLDPAAVSRYLFEHNIGIVMVEAGQAVLTSFWQARLADRAMVLIGNKILGGAGSMSPLGGPDPSGMAGAAFLENRRVRTFGADILIEGDTCFPA